MHKACFSLSFIVNVICSKCCEVYCTNLSETLSKQYSVFVLLLSVEHCTLKKKNHWHIVKNTFALCALREYDCEVLNERMFGIYYYSKKEPLRLVTVAAGCSGRACWNMAACCCPLVLTVEVHFHWCQIVLLYLLWGSISTGARLSSCTYCKGPFPLVPDCPLVLTVRDHFNWCQVVLLYLL